MKKINYKVIVFTFFTLLLFLCPITIYAQGNVTTGFSGNSSVYVGNTIDVILYVDSVSGTTDNGGLAAFGGNLSYSTDKLELVGSQSLGPFAVELINGKFGGFGQNTIKGRTNIMKLTFKAKALGGASISYSGSRQPDASASPVTISGCSKNINIVNPPSGNNNLGSLTVSPGGINFNKNTTNYNVSVGSNVTSVNINATAEDFGAMVSGIGTKSLNYGNNAFQIIVTAPNGARKVYTVNVNRKDDRSSNNKLASLVVNGGELKPKFSSNTLNYKLDVPYSISSLNVNAKAEDSKAKVSVINQNNLVAEETTTVKILVTAENGSTRTYTISVTRGKDPNKVLSKNNYLSGLNVSSGVLSPAFNKNQKKYVVYVPYEVDKFSIDAQVEDTKYGKVKIDGPSKLSVGSNKYKVMVTAEDNSTAVYVVIVVRGENVLLQDLSSNIYLKSIKISDGKLKDTFSKDKFFYKYVKGKDFKIKATPEDKDSIVTIIEHEDVITILVESPSGEFGVYTLVLKKSNLFFALLISSLILVIGGGLFYYWKKKKKRTRNLENGSVEIEEL